MNPAHICAPAICVPYEAATRGTTNRRDATQMQKDRERHMDDQYRRDGNMGMTRFGSNVMRLKKGKPKPRDGESWVVDMLKGYYCWGGSG